MPPLPAFLLFASPALAQDITGPARIIWGTIQKFAWARHQSTAAHRAQVQSSYADYKRWLAQEMGAERRREEPLQGRPVVAPQLAPLARAGLILGARAAEASGQTAL